MKEERKVFIVIGAVVLAFILFLPTIVSWIHPYTYVGNKDKKTEQKEETNNQEQQNNGSNSTNNSTSKEDIANTILETTVITTPSLDNSIKKVSNKDGRVRCFVSSSSAIYDSEFGNILYYEDYKIKKMAFETKTIYHTDDLINDTIENVKKENEVWKNVDGITVTASYDEATKTSLTTVLMDLSVGINFEASNGDTYSSNIAYDADINDVLSSKVFADTFCMEIE